MRVASNMNVRVDVLAVAARAASCLVFGKESEKRDPSDRWLSDDDSSVQLGRKRCVVWMVFLKKFP